MAEANFKNRTMWTRDNLEVLRGLNSESVDLVYADPPFNSNKNYEAPIGSKAAGAAFKDTWTLSDVDVAWHGEIADREPSVYAAIEAAAVVHGKGMRSYLTMMAVRLLELRRVLKPTGSLYCTVIRRRTRTCGCSLMVCLARRRFGMRSFGAIAALRTCSDTSPGSTTRCCSAR